MDHGLACSDNYLPKEDRQDERLKDDDVQCRVLVLRSASSSTRYLKGSP